MSFTPNIMQKLNENMMPMLALGRNSYDIFLHREISNYRSYISL